MEKTHFTELYRGFKSDKKVVAMVAPAIAGQFKVPMEKIVGAFRGGAAYYRLGVLRSVFRPNASARLCWVRVCLDRIVATRFGPFSPWVG